MCVRAVRYEGSVRAGGILLMKTVSETIGTALKIGGVCAVLILVVTLSVLIVLVEACFAKLMLWTTLLREKMMTAYGWTVRTFNPYATNATTAKLKMSGVDAEMWIEKIRKKLRI
jgi:hypothetical protein